MTEQREILGGRVSLRVLRPKQVVEFKQNGSDYIHKVFFRELVQGEAGRKALFVYWSFQDQVLKELRLSVLGEDNVGYVDFRSVDFYTGLIYKGMSNGLSRNDYYNICGLLGWEED